MTDTADTSCRSQLAGVTELTDVLAEADAALDVDKVLFLAGTISGIVRDLVNNPETPQGDVAGCIPLRLVRHSLAHEPRELFDAAVRMLESQMVPPQIEVTCLDNPTPADVAEAVLVVVDDEAFLCNQLGLIED